MVSKFGLAVIAATAIALSPLAAKACARDHSAQLNDGTQLAQAQDPSPMQQMDNQGSSAENQQPPANESDDSK